MEIDLAKVPHSSGPQVFESFRALLSKFLISNQKRRKTSLRNKLPWAHKKHGPIALLFFLTTFSKKAMSSSALSGQGGETKCSGLNVVRYDAESLHQEFGVRFRLQASSKEIHCTPFGTFQQFLCCLCRIE